MSSRQIKHKVLTDLSPLWKESTIRQYWPAWLKNPNHVRAATAKTVAVYPISLSEEPKINHGIEFTYDELSTIMDSIYKEKQNYELRSNIFIRDHPQYSGKEYYENTYKPTQKHFDEIRNKCIDIRAIMREQEKKSKGVK